MRMCFFLRFYERRNKFRYQLRRKRKEKNQMKRKLSACVIQKFNGYELLRNHLNSTERKNCIPIDVAYEPTLNDKKPIECFFAPKIYLIPRLVIFRKYDQNANALISLTHFQALQYDFFSDPENYNKITLKQLEDAVFSVQNRENNTALAEMFSIELKFTIDCLKFWFQKNHKILELEIDFKTEFKQNNPLAKKTLCCLCDFPMDPRAKNGWANHVFKAERLFLEHIYSQKQMVLMGIAKFEHFSKKLNKILDDLNSFCASIQGENTLSSEILKS